MKKLKSLSEFNKERRKRYIIGEKEKQWNGIACPECGNELFDSSPSMELTSYPPQKRVACVNCKFTGTRVS